MRRSHLLAALCAAMLILLQACNFPVPTPTGQQYSATATAIALTQGAGGVPVTGGTGTPTQPILSVQSPTNCWAGPGNSYPLVATLNPGSGFLIIGQNSSGNFWIIANPTGGSCWVSVKRAIVAGDTSRLPAYPAPSVGTKVPVPTTTPSASLPAPTYLSASRACGKGFSGKTPVWIEGVILTWQPSAGQEGYRVYRNNQLVGPVSAGATTDSIQFAYPRSNNAQPDTFGVEAFLGPTTSVRATVNVPRCP